MKKVTEWNKARDDVCACICEILDSRTQKTIASSESISLSSDFIEVSGVSDMCYIEFIHESSEAAIALVRVAEWSYISSFTFIVVMYN